MTGQSSDTETTMGNRRHSRDCKDGKSVRVQAANGHPLNPCHPARARELLRKKCAIRVCRHPFTIRLRSERQVEPLQQLNLEDHTP
ncbi:RRXRR domain-containing protein [Methylomonas sp. MgM2]